MILIKEKETERRRGTADERLIATGTIVLALATIALVAATGLLFWSSEKVAHAAQDSAVVARLTMINAQRAFVRVKDNQSLMRLYPDNVVLPVALENVGSTPANNLHLTMSWHFFTGEKPDDCPAPDLRSIVKRPTAFLAPKSEYGPVLAPIPRATFDKAVRGEGYLLVKGLVTYDDIFAGSPRHTTEFCVEYIAIVKGNLSPATTETLGGMSLYGSKNRMD